MADKEVQDKTEEQAKPRIMMMTNCHRTADMKKGEQNKRYG